ncbi:portal protein, partial [Mycoplasmopsis arginini]|uniref:portal protein n=1 Tax=Mycoplasmopsis arginini TaxID=2094 RepID=UPI00249E25E9
EFGNEVLTQGKPEVLEDEPCIELMPIENLRIDPGANWINPIKSSPYVIRLIPMYVTDIKTMMQKVDTKTSQPKWKKLDDGEIRSAMTNEFDTTRQAREGKRQDSQSQNNAPLQDFEIVWVHENFIRLDGKEVVYYTLGTEFMLTDPKPLKEVYFHGERPIVLGVAVLETHKIMPDSPISLGENLQREANEIVNQRLDNVKLVLNKRYIVKRGAQVDIKSLVRNVAASVTLANDPASDIKTLEYNDVTSSSYQEQDRLNVDYDELTGNFSQGSVMSNRKMNETVGGMNLISGSANQLTEYTIRTITETWVEKVLQQLVKLEQAYETDETIFAIAADRAKLVERFGVSEINDSLLQHELTLTVNVGMGATDPNQKLGKFMSASKAYGELALMQLPNVDMAEVGKEIFGLAGYRDGRRFLQQEADKENPENNPHLKQAIETMDKMQEQIDQLKSGEMSKAAESQAKTTEIQAK